MKNLLKLHEAIAVVLLSKHHKTATFQEIADEIDERGLFPIRKGGITLAKQVKLRTSIASSKYKYLFEFIKPDSIKLI